MRVLVIDALTLGRGQRHFTRDFIGAGPRMAAATLEHAGQEVSIIRGEDFLENSSLHARNQDICFISAMSMDKTSVFNIARKWKKARGPEENLVFAGGPIASDHESLLQEGSIDFTVIGQGEKIILNAFQGNNMEKIKDEAPTNGLVSRADSGTINVQEYLSRYRPGIPLIEKIDPGMHLLKSYDNNWAARVYIECMRGCSNLYRARINANGEYICQECGKCDQCTNLKVDEPCPAGILPGCGFCSTPAVFGPIRSFSQDYIIDQIKAAITMGCHRIVLGGSDFFEYKREELFENGYTRPRMPPGPNHEALESLVSSITCLRDVEGGNVQIFIENVKASLCDEQSLDIISKIPKISLTIGVETGCDHHLDLIGKPTSIDEVKDAIRLANKHGIRHSAYFIHSLPGQTSETVKKSVKLMKWLQGHGLEKITIYRFKPLPMTAFQDFKLKKKTLRESSGLVKLARQINSSKKDQYIGKEYDVLIAEDDYRQEGDAVAYMLQGGPKIKIKGGKKYVNDRQIHRVRVTGMISDKIVLGEILKN